MKLVFMGTPEFAVPSLKTLIDSEHEVVGVVTGPDKPAGRGKKMRPSAVKRAALEYHLPLLQPEKLRDPGFVEKLKSWNADLFVIVAFRILPEVVFAMPPKGTFNLHASLLPRYRGAAPINWALINGDRESGVTTFFLERQVDAGQMLLQRSVPLNDDMTAGELHDLLAQIGAELVLQTVNCIADGSCRPRPQVGEPTKAPKLTPELGHIDWRQDARRLHNLIRGLSPIPGCYSSFRGKRIKILRSQVTGASETDVKPGTVVAVPKNGPIQVQTGSGVLALLHVKPEGKKLMSAADFARGSRIKKGEVFD